MGGDAAAGVRTSVRWEAGVIAPPRSTSGCRSLWRLCWRLQGGVAVGAWTPSGDGDRMLAYIKRGDSEGGAFNPSTSPEGLLDVCTGEKRVGLLNSPCRGCGVSLPRCERADMPAAPFGVWER